MSGFPEQWERRDAAAALAVLRFDLWRELRMDTIPSVQRPIRPLDGLPGLPGRH